MLIIFVNKYLMGRKGYDFHYGERSVFFCCCFWMERRGGGGEREGEKTWGERERERATRREGDGTREQKKGKTKLQKKRLSFTPFFPRHPPPPHKKKATTLCALHYLACTASTLALNAAAGTKRVRMPSLDLLLFTLTADASIVSLNLSLMLNPVGYYQVAKLLIIPFVCLVEKFWFDRRFSAGVVASVATVAVGVAVVTITDLSPSASASSAASGGLLGACIAAISVVTSGMQQILCRSMQQKHGLTPNELLSNTAPAQVGVFFRFLFCFVFQPRSLVLS